MAKEHNINNDIKFEKINLVLSDGSMSEGLLLSEALKMAEEEGLDIVELSEGGEDRLPVCKILDYGKLMYQRSKKKKNQKNIQHTKEMRYNLNIDNHDLKVKHKKILKFLSKHYIVRYTMELKGREKQMIDSALDKININLQDFESIATWQKPEISHGNRVLISTVLNPL